MDEEENVQSEFGSERSPESDIMRMAQEDVRAQMIQVSSDAGHHGVEAGSPATARKEEESLGADFQLESLEEEPDGSHGVLEELMVRSAPKRIEEQQEHRSGLQ